MAARPLAGLTVALSASGVAGGQKTLARLIGSHGGTVSNIVCPKVDLLVATHAAVVRNTQAVRKARDKYAIPLVDPSFVLETIRLSAIPSVEDHPPGTGSADDAIAVPGGIPATLAPAKGDPPEGLCALEVLVEMSDPPPLQWWPATLGSRCGDASMGSTLVYEALPARGYTEPTPSRALFDTASTAAGGRLWDIEEQTWREWRRSCEVAAAAPGATEEAGIEEGSGASGDANHPAARTVGRLRYRRTGRRGLLWASQATSAARAFCRGLGRRSVRRESRRRSVALELRSAKHAARRKERDRRPTAENHSTKD